MDPLSAIGLAFTLIKLLMAIYDYLQAHPGVTSEVKSALSTARANLTVIHADLTNRYPDYAAFQGA